jgi:predicted negative regulator of RcsB-dependent stress response
VAKKKRVTRKELLREPDEFFTFSGKVIRFVSENRKPVIGVVIGVFVLVLAVLGFQYFSKVSESKAYAMFEQARQSYQRGMPGNAQASARDEAIKTYEKVIQEYPSTKAAQLSLMAYGDLSYEGGDYDKAIELYERALSAFTGERIIQKLIWNGLGQAQEAKKDYEAAAGYFAKMTEGPDTFLQADAYYNLGRMKEATNDQRGALDAYKKALETTDDTAGFRMVEERVRRLEAVVGTPEPSEPVEEGGSES